MSLMSTPERMLEDLKDNLDIRNENFWTNRILMKRLHDAQQDVVREITQEQPSYFVAEAGVDLVADQKDYDMPLNARLGTRWMAAENRISGTPYFYVFDIDLRRSLYASEHPTLPWVSPDAPQVSWIGNQIRVSPTPSSAVSNGIQFLYSLMHGNMLQGATTGTGSTTFSLYSGDPDFATSNGSFGYVDNRDDFYNGMTAFVVSGAGAGQERKISDYDGSARQFTVDTAWTTRLQTTTGTSYVAVMCPTPEDFRDVVVLKASLTASAKGKQRQAALRDLYYGTPGRPGRWHEMMSWVGERQDFQPQAVEPWGAPY